MRSIAVAVYVAFAAAALSWNPSSADSFTSAPAPSKLILDSNPQNGNIPAWKIDDLGSINAVRTSVRVPRLDYDPFKTPSFTITLSGGDYKVVFNVLSTNFRPPLTVRLEYWVGDTFWQQRLFAAPLKLDESRDLAIDWTTDGNVTVKCGDETQTLYLGAPVSSVAFAASVGEIEFAPFQIGHVNAPARPPGPYSL